MKQMFGIFLSLIYLLLIIGVPISVHHCNSGHATNISLWNSTDCSCSVELESEDTCCSETIEIFTDCNSTICIINEVGHECCSNQKEIINWIPEQQMISSFYMVFSKVETELFIISDKILDAQNVLNENPDEFGLSPPTKLSKIIFQHQFIFYA